MKTLVIKIDIADEAAARLNKSEYDYDHIEGWQSGTKRNMWDLYLAQGKAQEGHFDYLTGHNPRMKVIDYE